MKKSAQSGTSRTAVAAMFGRDRHGNVMDCVGAPATQWTGGTDQRGGIDQMTT
jgi:hypothetical protein